MLNSIKYVWRNVSRNKLRSGLTVLSVAFSLALMTVLYGYLSMQDQWGNEAGKHSRLVVMSSQGFSGNLPVSYVDRIKAMPEVVAAVPYSWYGGMYKDQQMAFAQFGTDPKSAFDVWSEYKIAPEQIKAFQEDRQACVADARLAERMGWKIGERIPLQGTFYPFNLDLKLVGTFVAPQNTDSLWFNWYYLDEGLRALANEGAGNSGTIFTKLADSNSLASVAKKIDDRFESSDNPTRTQTEAAFAQMFADMLGNIKEYIFFIGAAVVFSLTLVAATAMAMAMRERTTEIAVLKAIGFSQNKVLGLVLGESCMITTLGGLLGIGMGCLFLQGLHGISPQFFPFNITEMAGAWLIILLLIAAGIGLASGIVPAVRAAQLSVVNGLRRLV
jgi:putative ABC transport system permease protein